ncbi:unnamed protein product, partial [Ectocarpus sp. 12 AP-2014]
RLVLILPRRKGDVWGDGRVGYLSDQATKFFDDWMSKTRTESGTLFRGTRGDLVSKTTLETSTIDQLTKRAARQPSIVRSSSHSNRLIDALRAAQDMMVAGFDSLAILQSGCWKTLPIVLSDVERASTRQIQERCWQRLH